MLWALTVSKVLIQSSCAKLLETTYRPPGLIRNNLPIIFIKFIGLHYTRFYNISNIPLLLEFTGADLIWFLIRIISNTISKAMLVAKKKMTFLLSRIWIMLTIPLIKILVKKQFFLFKDKQFHSRLKNKNWLCH